MLTMATVFWRRTPRAAPPRSKPPAPGIPGRVPAVTKSPAELTGSRSVSGPAGRSIPPAAQPPLPIPWRTVSWPAPTCSPRLRPHGGDH
jgi:hypothetical protein